MAEAQTNTKPKKWPRTARGGAEKPCTVQGCKRPYRAKGYCFFHFKKWRQGDLPHSRYRTCSKTDCRKKAEMHGLCTQHYGEANKKAEAAAPAAPATPAAP